VIDPRQHAPVYRIDTLRLSALGHVDELGREWLLTGEKGWSNAPAPRTNREAKPDADGSFRSVARRNEKTLTVRGAVHCDDPSLIEQTMHELAALCSDGGRLYTLRRTAGPWDMTRAVEIDGEPELETVGLFDLDFEFPFAAPDPRKHDYFWQEPRSTSAGGNTGGLDDSDGGLSDAGGGLDAGAAADPIPARVGNYGTAVARPFFTLRGLTNGLPQPTIVCAETGDTITYRGDLIADEVVRINCDEFPARGVAAQSAVSNVRGEVSSLLTVGLAWPSVAAQAAASYQLLTAGTSEALTAALRSAWR
jgi:hypothetical protein